jgi:hypothetical protein
MLTLPSSAEPVFMSLSVAFSDPVFQHVLVLMVGAILARGRHTVTAILQIMGPLATAHFSTYHRTLSRAVWSSQLLQRTLARLVLKLLPLDRVVEVVLDETVARHGGPKVYGRGCHRDALRSSRDHKVFCWGHKWVTLAILVPIPFARGSWALPISTALSLPKKLCRAQKRRYKTVPDLARQMIASLIHAFPERKFMFVGDGAYGTVELAEFCSRHGQALVSRLRPDAALYAEPPKTAGRRLLVGRRLDSPRGAAQRKNASWTQRGISWYGQRKRRLRWLTGSAIWYRRGRTPIRLRWVYVQDREGKYDDTCLFSTDLSLRPEEIIQRYIRRWGIELTFEEVRAHLGFETTRQWSRKAALRAAPALLGMYTVISLIYVAHAQHHPIHPRSTPWYHKEHITFSDALAIVRRLFWRQTVMSHWCKNGQCDKLPASLKRLVLDEFCMAA